MWCTEGQPVYRWSLNSAGYPCPCPPLLRPVASFLTAQPLATPLMVLLCCNLLSLAEGGSTTVVVGVSICFAAGIVASSEGGSPPFRSVVVRSARIRSGSSLTPQRFRSGSEAVPQRFRSGSGSALPPQWLRSGSALLPKWFHTSSALLPQRFRTTFELLPHYFRSGSALPPHYFRSGPCEVGLSGEGANRPQARVCVGTDRRRVFVWWVVCVCGHLSKNVSFSSPFFFLFLCIFFWLHDFFLKRRWARFLRCQSR